MSGILPVRGLSRIMIISKLVNLYQQKAFVKPLLHIVFWVLYFTLNVFRWGYYFGDYNYSLKSNLVEFPIHIVLVYFNLNYLIKKFIPKQVTLYVIFILLAVMFMSCVRIVLTYFLVTEEIYRESTIASGGSVNPDYLLPNYLIAVFIGELYVVGLTMAIKLTVDWVRSEKKSKELEQRNLETELSMLRSQMQPHFFFNTLNNLYALTLEKSDQAPETVLKLSELMSYVIYKGKNSQVDLIQEVQHLNNYLNLERLRYDTRLNVDFDIEGKLENHRIPPLILVTFLENAFKHGSGNKLGEINIAIKLQAEEKQVYFRIENDFSASGEGVNGKKVKGIGIENTKRRLDLLYKENYVLNIQKKMGKFSVELAIPTL